MCGIAGAFAFGASHPVDREGIATMGRALTHRGPDDSGTFFDGSGTAGFAFRRLSIVDLSPSGHQPLHSEDGRFTLVLNGEIYNHEELRTELEKQGHRFVGRSDAEAVVHSVEEHWTKTPAALLGKFAFAAWDSRERRLLLVRDRAGVKPLYYRSQGGVLLFASEARALFAYPGVSREVDWQGIRQYLGFMATPAPLTGFAGIRKLPPGHFLEASFGNEPRAMPFWDPADAPPTAAGTSFEGASTEILRRLSAAVRRRCMGDVPIGAFLSGGVDSSAVVALMARAGAARIKTFSIGYPGNGLADESGPARQVAQMFGAEHTQIDLHAALALDVVDDVGGAEDDLVGDPVCVPLFVLSRAAHAAGLKVVQLGEGADELFAGYPWYLPYVEAQSTFDRLERVVGRRAARTIASAAARGLGVVGRAPTLGGMLRRLALGGSAFCGGAAAFGDTEIDRIIPHEASPLASEFLEPLAQRSGLRHDFDALSRMTDLELRHRLPELLLMRVDKMGMAHALEGRVPFLDHELIEFVLPLPKSIKLRNGPKGLLKHALRGLVPDHILSRPKVGFPSPLRDWFTQWGENEVKRRLFEGSIVTSGLIERTAVQAQWEFHQAHPEVYPIRLWLLINLAAWFERAIEGKSSR